MSTREIYRKWCEKVTDEELLSELKAMEGNDTAVENAFFKELEFGTGGLRGEIGAGTNCLNIYTIRKVTQGIADCMKIHKWKTAAVSHDSRIHSDLFARTVAEVFAENGIKTYLTPELMPTPFLSYMTRQCKADIGVMVTASHNPAKYNGYKVYGADGCQLTDAGATEMIGYINPVDPFKVKTEPIERYMQKGLVEYIGDGLIDSYLAEVKKQRINSAEGLSVVYSPLNGTGYKLVPRILEETGVRDITVVPEQGYPDGTFKTCPYPNPEKPEALTLGLKLAAEKGADILIATDPDADRIGIAVKSNDGYKLMTGNEVGVLLLDYVFAERAKQGTLPKNPVVVKTIVTTGLAEKLARDLGAELYNVLTGFKYIGDVIGKLEAKGEEGRFVLGFEESYGYLAGSYVRDKDAVVASMLIAEMAATYKKRGMTLLDRIAQIYEKYGTYQHKTISFEFAGAEGNAKMKELLSAVRKNMPASMGGSKVTDTLDYLTQTKFDLPKSNVLWLRMEDGSELVVRPSGTEPLIKMYITACRTPEKNAATFDAVAADLNKIFK